MPSVDIHAQFVVSATEILQERVPGTDHPRRTESFEAAQQPVDVFDAGPTYQQRIPTRRADQPRWALPGGGTLVISSGSARRSDRSYSSPSPPDGTET